MAQRAADVNERVKLSTTTGRKRRRTAAPAIIVRRESKGFPPAVAILTERVPGTRRKTSSEAEDAITKRRLRKVDAARARTAGTARTASPSQFGTLAAKQRPCD